MQVIGMGSIGMLKRLHPFFEEEGNPGSSTSVEGAENAAAQANQDPPEDDVTKQESFAKRLKESTEKVLAEERTKWEQENESKAQQARDALIAEQGYEWNGKPIKTEAEYKQAMQEQQLLEQYKSKDLPEDVVKELVESKKFREQYESEKQTKAQREKQEADFAAFMSTYPDADPNAIPPTVWAEVNQGKSLVDAYARYENQQLKQKLAEFNKSTEIDKQNADNAASSTGTVTGSASSAPAFFTHDQVQKMTPDEVNKNWDAIMASQKKWYS